MKIKKETCNTEKQRPDGERSKLPRGIYRNDRGKLAIHILYKHIDGREERVRVTAPVQTVRGAEAHKRHILNALENGTWRKLKNPAPDELPEAKPTVKTLVEYEEDYFKLCRATDEKPGSLETKESAFRAHLIPVFGERRLDSFTSKDANTLLMRFAGKAASTYNNTATTLNSVLEAAKDAEIIAEVPWFFTMRRRPKPKDSFYEAEVYEEMIAAARRLDDTTAEVAVLITGEVGLRRGECYPLLVRHCRIRERKVVVEDSELIIEKVRVLSDPKGRKPRTVDMSERVAEVLERHFARTGRRTGRVFLRPDGSPFTDHTWRDMIIRVEKEAGLEDGTGKTHVFRHTYCSALAMLNVSTLAIKALAGHDSITTTERYMHLSPRAKTTALELLNDRQRLLTGKPGRAMEPT